MSYGKKNMVFHILCIFIYPRVSLVLNIADIYIYIHTYIHTYIILQDGALKIVKLPYKWLKHMVYGRYNELVNGLYKNQPT